MTDREANVVREHPTEAEPSVGSAALSIEDQEVVLSEGVWWIEPNGDYVIRSVEFDVVAGGPTFQDTLAKFIDNVWEFGVYLAELEDRAENEEEMFHLLAPRLLRISRELERCLEAKEHRPFISVNLPRRGRSRHDSREWLPSSRQLGSRVPSHA